MVHASVMCDTHHAMSPGAGGAGDLLSGDDQRDRRKRGKQLSTPFPSLALCLILFLFLLIHNPQFICERISKHKMWNGVMMPLVLSSLDPWIQREERRITGIPIPNYRTAGGGKQQQESPVCVTLSFPAEFHRETETDKQGIR